MRTDDANGTKWRVATHIDGAARFKPGVSFQIMQSSMCNRMATDNQIAIPVLAFMYRGAEEPMLARSPGQHVDVLCRSAVRSARFHLLKHTDINIIAVHQIMHAT